MTGPVAAPFDPVDLAALEDPVGGSLVGVHREWALQEGRVRRYPADVAPFASLPKDATGEDWADLARLAGSGRVALAGFGAEAPAGWRVERRFDVVQMVRPRGAGGADVDGDIRPLDAADRAEMLALAQLTAPGPFAARTAELGPFLGVRVDGRLAAMAGERFQPGRWSEISAVCTHPDFRGRGLARGLMERVDSDIRRRGRLPFLHVAADNADARRLYRAMGFVERSTRPLTVLVVTA